MKNNNFFVIVFLLCRNFQVECCNFDLPTTGVLCTTSANCGHGYECDGTPASPTYEKCCPIPGIESAHVVYKKSSGSLVDGAWIPEEIDPDPSITFDLHTVQNLIAIKMESVLINIELVTVDCASNITFHVDVQEHDSIQPSGPWNRISSQGTFQNFLYFSENEIVQARFIRISPTGTANCVKPKIFVKKGPIIGSSEFPLPAMAFKTTDWVPGHGPEQIRLDGNGLVPFSAPAPNKKFLVVDLGTRTEVTSITLGSAMVGDEVCGLDGVALFASNFLVVNNLQVNITGPSGINSTYAVDIPMPPGTTLRYLQMNSLPQSIQACLRLEIHTKDVGIRGQISERVCQENGTVDLVCPENHVVRVDYIGKARMSILKCMQPYEPPLQVDLGQEIECRERRLFGEELDWLCSTKECTVDISLLEYNTTCASRAEGPLFVDQTRITYHCEPQDMSMDHLKFDMKNSLGCIAQCETALYELPIFPYHDQWTFDSMKINDTNETGPPMTEPDFWVCPESNMTENLCSTPGQGGFPLQVQLFNNGTDCSKGDIVGFGCSQEGLELSGAMINASSYSLPSLFISGCRNVSIWYYMEGFDTTISLEIEIDSYTMVSSVSCTSGDQIYCNSWNELNLFVFNTVASTLMKVRVTALKLGLAVIKLKDLSVWAELCPTTSTLSTSTMSAGSTANDSNATTQTTRIYNTTDATTTDDFSSESEEPIMAGNNTTYDFGNETGSLLMDGSNTTDGFRSETRSPMMDSSNATDGFRSETGSSMMDGSNSTDGFRTETVSPMMDGSNASDGFRSETGSSMMDGSNPTDGFRTETVSPMMDGSNASDGFRSETGSPMMDGSNPTDGFRTETVSPIMDGSNATDGFTSETGSSMIDGSNDTDDLASGTGSPMMDGATHGFRSETGSPIMDGSNATDGFTSETGSPMMDGSNATDDLASETESPMMDGATHGFRSETGSPMMDGSNATDGSRTETGSPMMDGSNATDGFRTETGSPMMDGSNATDGFRSETGSPMMDGSNPTDGFRTETVSPMMDGSNGSRSETVSPIMDGSNATDGFTRETGSPMMDGSNATDDLASETGSPMMNGATDGFKSETGSPMMDGSNATDGFRETVNPMMDGSNATDGSRTETGSPMMDGSNATDDLGFEGVTTQEPVAVGGMGTTSTSIYEGGGSETSQDSISSTISSHSKSSTLEEVPSTTPEPVICVSESIDGISFPATSGGSTAEGECSNYTASRKCSLLGDWETPNASNCQSSIGSSCRFGQKCTEVSSCKNDVCTLVCPTTGLWPETFVGSTAFIECTGSEMTRLCSDTGQWQTISLVGCHAYLGESCSSGQICQGGTECTTGVCKFWCSATGDWPRTLAGKTAYLPCEGSNKQRLCSENGQWEAIAYTGCHAYVGSTCAFGRSCTLNSVCQSDKCECPSNAHEIMANADGLGNPGCSLKQVPLHGSCINGETCIYGSVCEQSGTCLCPYGWIEHNAKCEILCFADGIWPITMNSVVVSKPCAHPVNANQTRLCSTTGSWQTISGINCISYPMDTCSYGEVCQGNSICTEGVCVCPVAYFTKTDPTTNQLTCEPDTSSLGESCQLGEVCMGGSVCSAASICQCMAPMIQLGDVCSYPTAGVGEICDITVICLDGSVCVDGKCACPQGTVEYIQVNGSIICPPNPCPSGTVYNQTSNSCLMDGAADIWESAVAACQDSGAPILMPKTEAQWNAYQSTRMDSNVWIGLRYYQNLLGHVWADQNSFQLTNYPWIPWLNTADPLSTANGYCVASKQANEYKWELTDCLDTNINVSCILFNGITNSFCASIGCQIGYACAAVQCPATEGWPLSNEFETHLMACPAPENLTQSRTCLSGGIWSTPDQSNCHAYATESCDYAPICQGSSYCAADVANEGMICTCSNGMEAQYSDGALAGHKSCEKKQVYPDESCAFGEICQSNSFCNTTDLICECPDNLMKSYNATLGKYQCYLVCSQEGNWIRTQIGGSVSLVCNGGAQHRTCLAAETWGPIDGSGCIANPSDSCLNGQICTSGSTCSTTSKICICRTGYEEYKNNETNLVSCFPIKKYIGEGCSSGVCQYGSTCQNQICKCTPGFEPVMDPFADKEVCVQTSALIGASCVNGEACQNSTCDPISKICECTSTQVEATVDGVSICVPEPCPGFSTNQLQCFHATTMTSYQMGLSLCQEDDSNYAIFRTKDSWTLFQNIRAVQGASDSRLAKVWLGLKYNSKWLWADGDLYAPVSGWNPWDTLFPNTDSGLCVYSSEEYNYKWRAGDCDDETMLALCYKEPDFCPPDGEWPMTDVGTTYDSSYCVDGGKKRTCSSEGLWGPVTLYQSGCAVSIGSSCASGETCVGNALCTPTAESGMGGMMCTCTAGTVPIAGANGEEVCSSPLSEPGESCDVVQTCIGGSVCNGLICVCPTGQEPLLNEQDVQVCTNVAYPTASCADGETCLSGSVCDVDTCICGQANPYLYHEAIGSEGECKPYSTLGQSCNEEAMCHPDLSANCTDGVCQCSIYALTEYEGACIFDYSLIGEACSLNKMCHPATQSVCQQGICHCIAPEFYAKPEDTFEVCRATARSPFGGSCFNDSNLGTICSLNSNMTCVDEECVCLENYLYRRDKCLLIGDCPNGEMWYESIEDCKLPIEGENCTSLCSPTHSVQCIDNLCKKPELGDECTSLCAEDLTTLCQVQGSSKVCVCRVGYQPVSGKCDSGKPVAGQACAVDLVENRLMDPACYGLSVCNLDVIPPRCECPEYMTLYSGGTCETTKKYYNESCAGIEKCMNGTTCMDGICSCAAGTYLVETTTVDNAGVSETQRNCTFWKCPADSTQDGFKTINWPATKATNDVTLKCDELLDQSGKGFKRFCNAGGVWETPRLMCSDQVSSPDSVNEQIDKMAILGQKNNVEMYDFLLSKIVLADDSVRPMGSIEIVDWCDQLEKVVHLNPAEQATVDYNETEWKLISSSFMQVADSYVNHSTKLVTQPPAAAQFIFSMESALKTMLNEFMQIKKKNQSFDGSFDPTANMNMEFFEIRPGQSNNEETSLGDGHCVLPHQTLDNPDIVMGKDNFGAMCSILKLQMPDTLGETAPDGYYLLMADQVISLSLTLDLSASKDFLVYLNFSVTDPNNGQKLMVPIKDAKCLYMQNITEGQSESLRYSTAGCKADSSGLGYLVCVCSHTTNYALLMSIKIPVGKSKHYDIMKWLSVSLLIISIIFLIVAILILIYIRNLRTQRIFILRNLCLVLLIALLCFITSIFVSTDPWHNEEISESRLNFCKVLAILMHCTFLSVFCWKLSMAVHLLLLVNRYPSDYLHASPPSWVFSVFSFGVPLVLVGVTGGVAWKDYGPADGSMDIAGDIEGKWTYCWINPSSWVKWTFIGPVLGISLFNLIILAFSSFKYCSIKGRYAQGLYFSSMRGSLRFVLSMIPVLGITWLVGCVLLVNEIGGDARLALEYIFIILNALQGFLMFVAIYFNEEVRLGLQMQKSGLVSPSDVWDDRDEIIREGTPIQIAYHHEENYS